MTRSLRLAGLAIIWTVPGVAALSYYYLNQIVTAQPMVWTYALVSTLPNWYLWGLMTPVVLYVAARYPLDEGQWKINLVAAHVPTLLGVMALHAMGNLLLFRWAGLHDTVNTELYSVHFTSRLHVNVIAYVTIVGAYYAYEYYSRYRQRERLASQLQVQLMEANLRALKMQLNPHFLFNTLNSVAALVRTNRNKAAVKMLVQLSEFLRMALESKGVQEIPLSEEIEFLRRYLDIESIRFKDRLRVEFDIEPAAKEAYVPNMILQPIVENAIHHGIAPNPDSGRLNVSAHVDGGYVVLRVDDDGKGIEDDSASGVGLSNTRERLDNLYPDNFGLAMKNRPSGGLRVEIEVPFHTDPVLNQTETYQLA
ncbi:MAG: histidine kinase [Bacteroidota bacterium]